MARRVGVVISVCGLIVVLGCTAVGELLCAATGTIGGLGALEFVEKSIQRAWQSIIATDVFWDDLCIVVRLGGHTVVVIGLRGPAGYVAAHDSVVISCTTVCEFPSAWSIQAVAWLNANYRNRMSAAALGAFWFSSLIVMASGVDDENGTTTGSARRLVVGAVLQAAEIAMVLLHAALHFVGLSFRDTKTALIFKSLILRGFLFGAHFR